MSQNLQFQQATIAHLDLLLILMAEFYANAMPFNLNIARSAMSTILQNEAYGLVWLIQREQSTVGYAAS